MTERERSGSIPGRVKSSTYMILLITVILFGTLFIFSKQVIPPLNSFTYLFLRSLLGTCFLAIVISFQGSWTNVAKLFRDHLKDALIISIPFHTLPLVMVFLATPLTSATNQVIINNLNLSFVVLINWLLFKVKATRAMLLAVAMNFLGLFLVIWPPNFEQNATLAGDLLMLAAVFIGAFFPAWQRRLSQATPAIVVSFLLNLVPVIVLAPVLLITDQFPSYASLSLPGWFMMVYIGVGVSGIAYWLASVAYKRDRALTPEKFSNFQTLIPVVGMLVSILVFGEQLVFSISTTGEEIGLLNLAGAIIVIMSVYIASRQPSDIPVSEAPAIEIGGKDAGAPSPRGNPGARFPP